MKDGFFDDKRVLVTGGAGFLGRRVMEALTRHGCRNVVVPRSRDFDLTSEAGTQKLFECYHFDLVIHIAGITGGIEYSRLHPGELFYRNLMMNTLVLEYARRSGVQKFVGIGTVCSYPKNAPIPMMEANLWEGYPEETNGPYGMAKKMMLVQSDAYRRQYQFNSVPLLLANLYGPEDNFDSASSHVIPAIIRKFVEAKRNGEGQVVAWGTGEATREFLYVDDAAEGIVMATERSNKPDPVNLGAGEETKIRELVNLIKELVGYEGEVAWDTSKPDGQPRRKLDTSRAKAEFGFEASVPLKEGLKRTIDWYQASTAGKPAVPVGHRRSGGR